MSEEVKQKEIQNNGQYVSETIGQKANTDHCVEQCVGSFASCTSRDDIRVMKEQDASGLEGRLCIPDATVHTPRCMSPRQTNDQEKIDKEHSNKSHGTEKNHMDFYAELLMNVFLSKIDRTPIEDADVAYGSTVFKYLSLAGIQKSIDAAKQYAIESLYQRACNGKNIIFALYNHSDMTMSDYGEDNRGMAVTCVQMFTATASDVDACVIGYYIKKCTPFKFVYEKSRLFDASGSATYVGNVSKSQGALTTYISRYALRQAVGISPSPGEELESEDVKKEAIEKGKENKENIDKVIHENVKTDTKRDFKPVINTR
ncbi:MAG: hypothetical protein ACRCX2_04915 [Paraclostridium sp.]